MLRHLVRQPSSLLFSMSPPVSCTVSLILSTLYSFSSFIIAYLVLKEQQHAEKKNIVYLERRETRKKEEVMLSTYFNYIF